MDKKFKPVINVDNVDKAPESCGLKMNTVPNETSPWPPWPLGTNGGNYELTKENNLYYQ